MISASAHKIYGPKGVGALIVRRRGYQKTPLTPLMYGGGQERGLRPGTLPVHLIVGFGVATELALKHSQERANICRAFREQVLNALAPLKPVIHGDLERCLPHVINFSIAGLDSEAAMLALKGMIAISNGSACTSSNYTPSHVLKATCLKTAPGALPEGALPLALIILTEGANIDVHKNLQGRCRKGRCPWL